MNKKETYVKIYRSLLEHEIWLKEPFTRGQAWVDLIGMANWGSTQKIYRGRLQNVERGQIQTSLGFLANRWHWSVGRVRRYFSLLNDMGMVQTNGTTSGMTITIENYAFFQDDRQTRSNANNTVDEHVGGIVGGTQKKNKEKNNKKESVSADSNSNMPQGRIVIDSNGYEYFVPDREVV